MRLSKIWINMSHSVIHFAGNCLSCTSPHSPIFFRHDEISLVMAKTFSPASSLQPPVPEVCAEIVLALCRVLCGTKNRLFAYPALVHTHLRFFVMTKFPWSRLRF